LSYNNPWLYNGEPLESEQIESYVGMVYLLENTMTGRFYVGKKFFWTTKPKMIKGKKKKIRCESDWKKYYGSNKLLQSEIEQYGVDIIRRSVLQLCFTKTQCSYYELYCQMISHALLRDDFYNGFVGGKINGKNIKFEIDEVISLDARVRNLLLG
jgi:hypothetical protein